MSMSKDSTQKVLSGKVGQSIIIDVKEVKCWINPRQKDLSRYLLDMQNRNPKNSYRTKSMLIPSMWSTHLKSIDPLISSVNSQIRRIGDNLDFGVSKDCRNLSIVVLKGTFEDAPRNNGDYVTKVLTSNVEFYPNSSSPYKRYSRYVISIDNKGKIEEGWWTSSDSIDSHMYKDSYLSNQRPNFPEPVMQSDNGIVCNIKITTSQDSTNFLGDDVSNIIIWATGKDAVLSEDKDGFKVKY